MGSLYKRGTSPIWQAAYVGADGKRQVKSTRTTSKEAAKVVLAKWETDVALRLAGVIDPAQERLAKQAARPIAQHIREFQQSLEAAGDSAKHVTYTIDIIKQITTPLASLGDLQPELAEAHAARLRSLGRSGRTIQRHLGAIKQFTRWAHQNGRLATNPMARIKSPSPDTDRRIERRALIPCTPTQVGEWPWLRLATESGPVLWDLPGTTRAILYELALQTGLRANEVRELSIGKLHLDQARPYVLLPSRSTKNKKPARQYIGEGLRDRLTAYIADRYGTLFDLPPESELARGLLRPDLDRARELWLDASDTPAERRLRTATDFLLPENSEGHVIDFHSLRHTCGAWLASKGVNPKAIQTIMRHSSITLTMDTYGHLFPDDAANAIATLQPLFQTSAQTSAQTLARSLPESARYADFSESSAASKKRKNPAKP